MAPAILYGDTEIPVQPTLGLAVGNIRFSNVSVFYTKHFIDECSNDAKTSERFGKLLFLCALPIFVSIKTVVISGRD